MFVPLGTRARLIFGSVRAMRRGGYRLRSPSKWSGHKEERKQNACNWN